MNSIIQYLAVTKVYDVKPQPVVALDNVSFEIHPGEFVFIVGSSGSGKTTLLKTLIREELPSSGKIFFEDEDVTQLKRTGIYRLRRKIGMVFQDFKLIEHKNTYENIAFAMEVAGQSREEIKETVPYVLEIVNLPQKAQAFPRELSGGEKQRVAIARAIANNPKVLIADEPTGNLDPSSVWDIVEILTKINKWGTTVIMSTHGTEIVNSLQKRVIKMQNGKLVRDDKKGRYEELDEFSLKLLQAADADEKPKAVKSLKSVKSKSSDKKDENPKEEGKETEKNIEKDETNKAEQTPSKLKTTVAEDEKLKPENNEEVKKTVNTLAAADQTGLQELKITTKLRKKLMEIGYKDVEDILTAGVAEVNNHLEKAEVRALAKAIKKFITTE